MTEFYTPAKDRPILEHLPPYDPALPKALLIGDSISQGYTVMVGELLRGRCNLRIPIANCGDTRLGLKHLDEWLDNVHWDVIHFNWGLHDLCHRHPESQVYGNRDKVNGAIAVPLKDYEQNLDLLARRMRPHTKQLIWASTTVVPEGEAGRHVGDDVKYNAAAARVMKKHAVPTNDLHAHSASFPSELFTAPGDVHFTEEGSRLLAQQVAASIQQQLNMI